MRMKGGKPLAFASLPCNDSLTVRRVVNAMRSTEDPPKHVPAVQPRIGSSNWSDLSAIRRLVSIVCSKWLRVLAAPRVSTFRAEMQYASWDQIGVGLGLITLAWMASDVLRNHVENA